MTALNQSQIQKELIMRATFLGSQIQNVFMLETLAAGTISGVCTFGYGFKKGLIIDGAESFESPLQILDFIKRNV